MKIDIAQLSMACDILWKHLHDLDIDSVDIPHDYYWSVPQQDVYRFDREPTTFVAGQLSDDWQYLQRLLKPDRDAIAYDLVKVSAILRAVGEQVVS